MKKPSKDGFICFNIMAVVKLSNGKHFAVPCEFHILNNGYDGENNEKI